MWVLLVESDVTVAGLVLEGLRKTIEDISIEYVNRLPQALDFLFHTGKYSSQTYEQKPDLIVIGLDLPNDDSVITPSRSRDGFSVYACPCPMGSLPSLIN